MGKRGKSGDDVGDNFDAIHQRSRDAISDKAAADVAAWVAKGKAHPPKYAESTCALASVGILGGLATLSYLAARVVGVA